MENVSQLSLEVLQTMDTVYHLSQQVNAEIRFRWQTLLMRAGSQEVIPEVVSFLKEQGRMKYVR
mgnify:FL=1